jgi:hypothetical protein
VSAGKVAHTDLQIGLKELKKLPASDLKAFGAPINPADAKAIGDYLKQNYGE